MTAGPVAEALRAARQQRRWSQLELAHRIGVSQRHVSFVETGRSRASRALLGAWLEALDVPLATRNVVLVHAGYAPAYSEAPLGAPEVAVVAEAMHRLLEVHDPYPAVVLDADWDVVETNRGFDWLVGSLMSQQGGDPSSPTTRLGSRDVVNMFDLLSGDNGLLSRIVNLPEAARAFLPELRHEAAANPRLARRLADLVADLRAAGVDVTREPALSNAFPVIPLRFMSDHGELALFTMFTTLGAPHSITAASLRVEHLFPLDDRTHDVFARELGAGLPPRMRLEPSRTREHSAETTRPGLP